MRSQPRTKDALLYRFVLSKANYWIGFGLDITLGLALVLYGIATHDGHGLSIVAAGLAGWATFSFTEYGVHRWGYHGPDSVLSRVHVFHHADPHAMVGVPLFYPLMIAGILIFLAQLFAPIALVAVYGGTIFLVYEAQTLAHAISHKWVRVQTSGLVKRLCRHHMVHHAGDGNMNFGMSTTFWDRVLRTYTPRVCRRSHAKTLRALQRRSRRSHRRRWTRQRYLPASDQLTVSVHRD